ncbi:hypothetical protein BBJ29_001397 [Phytophthora kernoviae]|uniref:Ketoreductase (KR) domain-containing protein n=1 Tax=Phytophthora kernoviae TaxID=325452 RepID=A0A421FLB6_9STRA|nr:hypothetical protein BBJ29_001397 [Phytophthora kernoviae]
MPRQHGRLAIVTGSNTGLGFSTALSLAKAGAYVVLACRNEARGLEAQKQIRDQLQIGNDDEHDAIGGAEYMRLDVGELQSIRDFAKSFKTRTLDMNQLSVKPENYDAMDAYRASKLSNLLFAYELHRRLEKAGVSPDQVLSVACHPGVTESNLLPNLASTYNSVIIRAIIGFVHWLPWAQSNEQGALNVLCVATDPNVGGGEFIGPNGLGEFYGWPRTVVSSKQSMSLEDACKLWEASEKLTGIKFLV